MKVKAISAIFFVSVCAGILLAQAVDPPAMPDKNRADILAIELRISQEQNEYAGLQARMTQLQTSFQKDSAELTTAQAAACKAAKVDCDKDYTLDLASLKFVKKQTPAPPAKK